MYASIAEGMDAQNNAQSLLVTLQVTEATAEIGVSLLPGGATMVHAIKGEGQDLAISVAGDAAYLLAGPLAKLAEARQAFRLAKGAYSRRPR